MVGSKWKNVGVVEEKPDEAASRRRVSPPVYTFPVRIRFPLLLSAIVGLHPLNQSPGHPKHPDWETVSIVHVHWLFFFFVGAKSTCSLPRVLKSTTA